MERLPPFQRVIQPEELWMYKYPHQASYFPVTILWPLVLLAPTIVISFFFWLRRDTRDAHQAILAVTLALSLNGMITDVIKVIVGRPRPDFYNRCFPDGNGNDELHCTGPAWLINDGRKSFPSGHSSFAFAGMGFVSLYLAGKLRTGGASEGQAWRLSVSIAPLLVALCIALSRTCDYHHHWQDVVVGSMLGLAITSLSYRLYFPWPVQGQRTHELNNLNSTPTLVMHENDEEVEDENTSLLQPREVKWI
ncbi:hypothetical protein B566_EDAN002864 [Ephemera danica]|nr:hypothetical protein B566_EDAN002864 [Ephemera danica]